MQTKAPARISGAKTLLFTVIDDRHWQTGKCRHVVNGEDVIKVYGLAICKYEDDPGYYLFYCGENWQPITDTWHETLDRAMDQAKFEFEGGCPTWERTA